METGEQKGGQLREVAIHIDRKLYKSPTPTTGLALKKLASIPAGYDLFEEVPGKGDDILIRDTDTIKLKDGEHFYSAQSSLNPGRGDVPLPDVDVSYLQSKGIEFTVIALVHETLLRIQNYILPDAYTPRQVELLIRLPIGYPSAMPDMFFTSPTVSLAKGGKPMRTESIVQLEGMQWQQWSRHFTRSLWRPGIDNIGSYLSSVKIELAKGI